MKKLLALVLCCAGLPVFAGEWQSDFALLGDLILTNLPSAPFPHPDRAKGHSYGTNFFSAEKHYSDSTVAFFVPQGFRASSQTDFIVHFHGWGNNVSNVFSFYRTANQLVDSQRNAILVVPQGPWKASDSFDGKLEDKGGFKNFMTDVVHGLVERGIVKSDKIGNIILSGHSGGFQVMSSIVEQNDLNDRIKEIWLFDALYGRTPKFMKWFDEYHGKILNIYTLHGGTKDESEKLMEDLKKRNVKFVSKLEQDITAKDLKKNRMVFIYSSLPHNEVMHVHNTFRDFLSASCFGEVKEKH